MIVDKYYVIEVTDDFKDGHSAFDYINNNTCDIRPASIEFMYNNVFGFLNDKYVKPSNFNLENKICFHVFGTLESINIYKELIIKLAKVKDCEICKGDNEV